MATVRISQLTAITAPTDDDVLIINDADTNTRKITFANLTQNLVNTTAATQTKSGAFTVSGTLTAGANFVVDTNTFFVDSVTNRIGVRTISPNTELDVDGTVHIRNSNTLQFGDANDSNYVSLGAPSVIAANFAMTLPAALPTANNLLWSNASGQLGYTAGIAYDSGTQAMSLGQAYFTNQGSVRFYEQSINGSEYVGFTAPASLSGTTGYTLPGTYPAASGYVLASTTGGVLSWVSNGAGAAGNVGDVQFSDGATLTANSNFNFNNGSQTLNVPSVVVGTLLQVDGNVQLGNSSGDLVTFTGSVNSNVQPNVTGAHDLGTSILHWAEAHVDDLYVYGNSEIGNSSANVVSINARVDSDVVPDADNTRDLGSTALKWAELHVHDVFADGNVQLGNSSGDQVAINGELTTDIIPSSSNTRDLGSASRRFAEAHVNQLSTYGTTTIGDTSADSFVVNAVVQSDLVPSGTFDLGSSSSRWTDIYGNMVDVAAAATVGTSLTVGTTIHQGSIATTSVHSNNNVAPAAAFAIDFGDRLVNASFKLMVQARDQITGDTEFYEYFLAQDGAGNFSDVVGSNVQSVPGTFLSTPSTAEVVVGSVTNIVVSITNTAASGNNISVKVYATAIAI